MLHATFIRLPGIRLPRHDSHFGRVVPGYGQIRLLGAGPELDCVRFLRLLRACRQHEHEGRRVAIGGQTGVRVAQTSRQLPAG